MLGRAGEKWNTGLARGSANQIWWYGIFINRIIYLL
jgi:hypothetical protein